MSGGCPNVDQEKSGPSAGWYCSVIGEAVGSDFHSNYCCSSVSYEYCPYIGGDDRLRNPECLTEEVCSCILYSVKMSLEYLNQYIADSIVRIIEKIEETGYECLGENLCQSGNYWIVTPDLSGKIEALVITDPERERAQELEQNLTQMFAQIQPANYLCSPKYLDLPSLASTVFDEIKDETHTYGWKAYTSIAENPIDTGGAVKYEEPVAEAQRIIGGEVYSYFKVLASGIDDAKRIFEKGCSSALSSIGNSRGYTGEPVIWRK